MYCTLMNSVINNNYGNAPPSFSHVGLIFHKLNGVPQKSQKYVFTFF